MSAFQIPDNQQVRTEDTVLYLTRTFDAPPEAVFEMFGPEHIAKWWMPLPWRVAESKMDFRTGGSWLYASQGPGSADKHWAVSKYSEVTPPKRIVFEDAFSDDQGNVNPDMPVSIGEFDFIDLGGKTEVRMKSTYASAEGLKQVVAMGMIEGLTIALNQLDALLAAR